MRSSISRNLPFIFAFIVLLKIKYKYLGEYCKHTIQYISTEKRRISFNIIRNTSASSCKGKTCLLIICIYFLLLHEVHLFLFSAIICTAEDCGPKKIIYLPTWKASSSSDYHSHFEKLRKTFLESLSHILNEPKVKKYATVCISTAKFQDERTDHPFPCDVIAKILLEHLLDAHCDTDSEFNIYICEPENEAVFKAFHFFLKLKWSLQHSDKDSMERICFKGKQLL